MKTYALMVETGCEEYVQSLLTQAFRHILKGAEARLYVPKKPIYVHLTAAEAKRNGGPLKLTYKNLYPGYVLVEFSDNILTFTQALKRCEFESWYRLIGRTAEGYIEVTDEELQWARLIGGQTWPCKARMKDGRLVFTSGPLKGKEDCVIEVKASRKHVCLQIPFKGEPRKVWIAVDIEE